MSFTPPPVPTGVGLEEATFGDGFSQQGIFQVERPAPGKSPWKIRHGKSPRNDETWRVLTSLNG